MEPIDGRMPVLVGCGDVTDLDTPAEAGRSPYDLIAQAARLALQDSGAAGMAEAIDTVAMIRSFADTSPRFATKLGTSTNPPRSVAQRLGLKASRHIYSYSGGNMPQYLLNQFAESIARGEMRRGAAVRRRGAAHPAWAGAHGCRRRVERGSRRHARADRRRAPRLERA